MKQQVTIWPFSLYGLPGKQRLLPITFLKSDEKKIVFPGVCVCIEGTVRSHFIRRTDFCHAITQKDSKTSQSLADTPRRVFPFKMKPDTIQKLMFTLVVQGNDEGLNNQSRQH